MTEQPHEIVEVKPAFLSDRPIEIFRFLHAEMIGGLRGALITLIEIVDGASRPLGAHMVVLEDGRYCGMVSGGCVEAAVAREALIALREAKDRICRFGRGSSFFDIVLPCGGGIALTIHVVTNLLPISALLGALTQRQPGSLAYDPSHQRLSFQDGRSSTGWEAGRFQTSYRPEPLIVLSGRGIETQSFASVAVAAGLEVISSDTIVPEENDQERAIVFLHHDLESELPLLAAALTTSAFFIGCLGSRRTQTERRRRLLNEGFAPEQLDRIHAPIGLFGPSRDARTLSVSVLAQILVIVEARRWS